MTNADTDPHQIEQVLARAAAAAPAVGDTSPAERAEWLEAIAHALHGAEDELLALAEEESGLPLQRLRGELRRTTFQLELFAQVLTEGSFLEAIIDHADPGAEPAPRPDLRRMLVPLGPIEVFAASNFPFAFSVSGGDTTAALAAGCPVILKAHPGHPRLSARTAEVVARALEGCGAPAGTFEVVFGVEAGTTVLRDPRVKGAAFTGSTAGGRALHDLAATRPEPIPFYGELGSLNPVFVTAAALAARGPDIIRGYVDSFTLGVGQFCTKPGLLFLPKGHGADQELAEAVRGVPSSRMLSADISRRYQDELDRLSGHPALEVLVDPGRAAADHAAPTLLRASATDLVNHPGELLTECFGPTSLLVEYADIDELVKTAAALTGQLTAAVHAEPEDIGALAPLLRILGDRAGRVMWNAWPTGVAVAWAMHHGGPYPATTTPLYTSVGPTSIRRFQRPVCYQSYPSELLPPALQDDNPLALPRRVDGTLQLP